MRAGRYDATLRFKGGLRLLRNIETVTNHEAVPTPPQTVAPPPAGPAAAGLVGRMSPLLALQPPTRNVASTTSPPPPPRRAQISEGTRPWPDGACAWRLPPPFHEAPFNHSLASVVWTSPPETPLGPLADVPAAELARDWPSAQRARLFALLPRAELIGQRKYRSCAVVGSSPELLMYRDGAEIDRHEAVFRANLAVVSGFEAYAGSRTHVRMMSRCRDAVADADARCGCGCTCACKYASTRACACVRMRAHARAVHVHACMRMRRARMHIHVHVQIHRTTVRIINPVESVKRARGTDVEQIIIKNQDSQRPPALACQQEAVLRNPLQQW